MVGVRSAFLKTAALAVVALFASTAAAQQAASAAPTTSPAPLATPATQTVAPTATPGARTLTTPAACLTATLKRVDNEIAVFCSGTQRDQVNLGAFTELTVGVLSPDLIVEQIIAPSIGKLEINGGAPGQIDYTGVRPIVTFVDGVVGFTNLTSLSLSTMNFSAASFNLKIPDSIAYIKIQSTNVEDVSLVVSDSSGLNQIELLDNHISAMPKCLYERQYKSPTKVIAKVDFLQDKVSVSADAYANLTSNINPTGSSFDLANTCALGTITPLGDTPGKPQVCSDGATTLTPSAAGGSTTTSPSSSTPSPSTEAAKSGGGSNTTLIVIIILVVVVVLALAAILYRRLASSRKNKSSSGDDNSVNLIGKDDATGNGKLSFISSDESLRALRLQQNEVTLSKSLGTGRLWLGEFAGSKVIIKRVEAEVSDAYVTKNLMNQSQVLASISHENIVPLVGVTWLAGTDFAVVAEFMDKSNLKNVLADTNWQLDIQTKLRMCLDIARGLAYLHAPERNMYLRNLSSGKVLVNASSECKLNLFDVYPSMTKFELPVESYGAGEVAWQAPEIITRSAPQDVRKINMYAFGVIMCEVLARAAPFQTLVDDVGNTLSDVEIVKRVRRQETLAPHENRREYMRAPQSLRDSIDLCLSLSPLHRPSASEMIVALEAAQIEVTATQQLV